ncbi:uncharacterized protein LOC142814197 isoform X1 [Rhipicephalus microplus]|uniref:uncharacterized protein LOC142814197 isoform X1 n=1 Tax=Rhipicephalus microplus TaxID=6941 RepID=UPI003F6BEBF9
MDLEKLVALGEKMGLSGAELRKWVSQKEKEAVERERLAAEKAKEEKTAELERERLAVERAKAEKEAELERERLAAERAKEEKAAELERERLAAERAREEREAKERQLKEEREAKERQLKEEREQQLKLELEREKLAAERAREEREAEMAERERQRQHEIELERLRLQQRNETPVQARVESSEREDHGFRLNPSKLLVAFDERKDDLDAYLHRFETIARSQNWPEQQWATALSTCLSGEALSVYGRLTPTDAANYAKVKAALLKRFRFTVEGFRDRFRTGKPADGETATQYAARLCHYFDRWIELSGTAQEYEELRELLIREQFLTSCHPSLSLYLKERRAKSLEDMLELADQFLEAQGGTNLAKVKKEGPEDSKKSAPEEKKHAPEKIPRCFLCNRVGHRASHCRTNFTSPTTVKCFKCGQTGHKADACRNGVSQTHQVSCVQAAPKSDNNAVTDGFVELKNGEKIPIVGAVMSKQPTGVTKGMPTLPGKIAGKKITVLRDTGSSTVIVRKNLVRERELTGRTKPVCLIDRTVRMLPEAEIEVETPYFSGKVTALCMTTPLYDLVIGNIDGARGPSDPECLGEDPKIEPSPTQRPRDTVEEHPVTGLTRAQGEAAAQETAKEKTIVSNKFTGRATGRTSARPQPTDSVKETELARRAKCRGIIKRVNKQTGPVECNDALTVSEETTMAETTPQISSLERARRKRTWKHKKRSSEHRKRGRKRCSKYSG